MTKISIKNLINNEPINIMMEFIYALMYLINIYNSLTNLCISEMHVGTCKNINALIKQDFKFFMMEMLTVFYTLAICIFFKFKKKLLW
jgi:hypothetical protein